MNNPKKHNKPPTKSSIRDALVFHPATIPNSHKFTRNTQSAFKKLINQFLNIKKSKLIAGNDLSIIRSIYRGRLVCRNANCFHLTVSESLANRAISFLDMLAKELESQKFKIAFQQDDTCNYVFATKDNERIRFHLSEGFKYHPIDNDKRSALESMLYRDRKPVPTGKLTISISAFETNINKSWSDGTRPIEDALPSVLLGFDNLVLRQKQRKIENAMKAKQRTEDAKRIGEMESIKYSEKRIFDDAMLEAQTFKEHQNLEEYLNYLEVNCIKEFGNLDDPIQLWLSTARKYAESQSPISKRLHKFSNFRDSIK
jgi:hypothetical protein